MTDVDGLILAAGRSSRMVSGNKVQALLAGRPLLAQVVDRLAPQVDKLFINGDSKLCAEACGDQLYPFIADRLEGFQGPLTGLYSALVSDQLSAAAYLMMTPCDGPFIPDNLVSELHQLILGERADIACIRYQGEVQPTFTLWKKSVVNAVENALLVDKNGGFKPLLQALNTVYLDWPEQSINPFFNINSCEDLALAEAAICP
jgi:molybdopterin-guanine dinucleotide biosynthesis protein A